MDWYWLDQVGETPAAFTLALDRALGGGGTGIVGRYSAGSAGHGIQLDPRYWVGFGIVQCAISWIPFSCACVCSVHVCQILIEVGGSKVGR